METREFLLHARIDAVALEAWIEAGWLIPRPDAEARRFSEIDVARARLIRDLTRDIGVNDEGVAVVLDLLDQLHGLRRTLRGVLACLAEQPEDTRQQIAAQVRATLSQRTEPG